MFINIYDTFAWACMKIVSKYEKFVFKYLNLLDFQIPAFRAFCKTAYPNVHILFVDFIHEYSPFLEIYAICNYYLSFRSNTYLFLGKNMDDY